MIHIVAIIPLLIKQHDVTLIDILTIRKIIENPCGRIVEIVDVARVNGALLVLNQDIATLLFIEELETVATVAILIELIVRCDGNLQIGITGR